MEENLPGRVTITNEKVMAQLRIIPLPMPTKAQMQGIPLGSEVIFVSWGEGGNLTAPKLGAMLWDEKTSGDFLDGITSNKPQANVFLMYLPPVSNPDTEAIVTEIMEREHMTTLDGLERINMRRLRAMLTEAATRGGRPF